MLDLYDVDDTQLAQLNRAQELAHHHLGELIAQQDAADFAIGDLREMLGWVESKLHTYDQAKTAK